LRTGLGDFTALAGDDFSLALHERLWLDSL